MGGHEFRGGVPYGGPFYQEILRFGIPYEGSPICVDPHIPENLDPRQEPREPNTP